jgi:hypothetical protein
LPVQPPHACKIEQLRNFAGIALWQTMEKEGDKQHLPYIAQSARNQMRNMQGCILRAKGKGPPTNGHT